MSIKRFNEFGKVNEAIGSKILSDLYTSLKRIRGEARNEYNKANNAYKDIEKSGEEYDSSIYTRKRDTERKYKEINEYYQTIKKFITKLSDWNMDIETIDDSIIDIFDESKGDDSNVLRRKPYSSDDYIILALEKVKLVDSKRDDSINNVLEDIPNSIYAPIGFFRSTWDIYGANNRKELLDRGELFYAIKPTRDANRGEIQKSRRDRKEDIVQPNHSYGYKQYKGSQGYDSDIKKDNIERYAKKLTSKRNYDHLHDIMVNIIKLKNDIELKHIESLKDFSKSGDSRDSGLKTAIVKFINNHISSFSVSDYRLYDKTSGSILNDLFNDYIEAYRNIKRERDISSSLKKLADYNIFLPDLEKFLKEFKSDE